MRTTISAMQVDSRTELVIAVEIAKRLEISPQRVNVLASGPGFPKPLGKLGPLVGLALEQRRALGARYGPASRWHIAGLTIGRHLVDADPPSG